MRNVCYILGFSFFLAVLGNSCRKEQELKINTSGFNDNRQSRSSENANGTTKKNITWRDFSNSLDNSNYDLLSSLDAESYALLSIEDQKIRNQLLEAILRDDRFNCEEKIVLSIKYGPKNSLHSVIDDYFRELNVNEISEVDAVIRTLPPSEDRTRLFQLLVTNMYRKGESVDNIKNYIQTLEYPNERRRATSSLNLSVSSDTNNIRN